MRVLVVEDVATMAALIALALRAAGMEVVCVCSGAEAQVAYDDFSPDIVLLDLALPDIDGMTLVTSFANDRCGVIVVSASSDETARVQALDIGADDYMIKPVLIHELAARIRAVHRRLQTRTMDDGAAIRIIVDCARRQLTSPEGSVALLTEAEMIAFEVLFDASGTPVSRESLSTTALKRPVHTEDRSVDQLVLKLRRKLAGLGCPERSILSVRRQGYVMADPGRFQKFVEPRHA